MHNIKSLSVFVLALALVAYIPGRLVLRAARIAVAPLDSLALSLNLGLVVSAIIYWFLAYFCFQQYFVFWTLIAAGIFAYHCRTEWFRPSIRIKGAHFLLIGTILLGVVLLVILPIYYSNLALTKDGGMKVCPLFDAPMHAAISNELTHSVPPQNPIFSELPLSYHVGADLPAAMFANITGLGAADLTVRYVPTFFLILTMLSVFCFSRRWLASDYGAALVTFLVVFGEDISFIPGLLQGSSYDWSAQYFGVPSTFSLFCLNPMLPALGFLFAGLYCLLKSTHERPLVWQLLSGLAFVALTECKIFTALHIAVSLVLAGAIYFAAFRSQQILRWAVITAIWIAPVMVGTFLANRSGAQIAASFFQSHALRDMVLQLGLTRQLTSLSSPPLSFSIAAAIYLIGSLGLRAIGIPAVVKEVLRPRVETPMSLLLAVFVVIGVMLGMAITILPKGVAEGYNNGVWFYVQSKYLAWLFAVEAILVMLRTRLLSRIQGVVIAAIVVAASVPSSVQHFVVFTAAYKAVLLSPNTVRVLEYLRIASHPGEVVFSPEGLVGPIVAMTKCHVPMGSYAEYMVPLEDYRRRVDDCKTLWANLYGGHIRDDILRAVGVKYLVIAKQKDARPAVIAGLEVTFEDGEWIVYRVTDVGASNTQGRDVEARPAGSNEPAMEGVKGLIKAKAAIAPSALNLQIFDLGGDYHSFHAVIPAPVLTASYQLSVDTSAGKARVHSI